MNSLITLSIISLQILFLHTHFSDGLPTQGTLNDCDQFKVDNSQLFLHCNQRRFTEVPKISKSQLTSPDLRIWLVLRGNELNRLTDESFQPDGPVEENDYIMESINLDGCNISDISNGSFQGLDHLKVLNLANNQLTKVPTDALHPLSKLEDLFLAGNPIETFLVDAFTILKNLERLDLSRTHISVIENSSFAPLTGLKLLNFTNSLLKTLTYQTFFGLTRQTHIDVRGNPFKCDCPLFDLQDESLIHEYNIDMNSDCKLAETEACKPKIVQATINEDGTVAECHVDTRILAKSVTISWYINDATDPITNSTGVAKDSVSSNNDAQHNKTSILQFRGLNCRQPYCKLQCRASNTAGTVQQEASTPGQEKLSPDESVPTDGTSVTPPLSTEKTTDPTNASSVTTISAPSEQSFSPSANTAETIDNSATTTETDVKT